jgi:multicomponent Na+:H+ antiporter subunit D
MNQQQALLFAPIYLPLLSSALILLCKEFFTTKVRRVAEYIGMLIGMGVPLVVVFSLFVHIQTHGALETVIGSWTREIGIVYRLDGLSLLMIVLAITITIPAWIYSRKVGPAHSSFTALLLIQNSAIAAISMTGDLFNLFVCLEVMGVAAYVLIASNQKGGAVYATFSYLMISSSAMVFFLLGTFSLYRLTGSLSYAGITESLALHGSKDKALVAASLSLIVVPVLLRVAVMPLSLWLVDAHSRAPHAVSAILSGVLLKIPLFALVRVLAISELGGSIGLAISYAGALTALFGVLLALAQSDGKRLLAYHSISQIGYVVSAWGLALAQGLHTSAGILLLATSFFHAFSHALFKALLFLSVGTATDAGASRNVYTLRGVNRMLKNEGEKFPLTMICFFVGALSITAIPPFNGYFSKTLLTYSLKGTLHYNLLTIAGVGTVASFIKLSRIFLPSKNTIEKVDRNLRPTFPFTIHLALVILATLCLITGLFAQQVIQCIGSVLPGKEQIIFENTFFYTAENLTKTFWTVASGIVLFFLAISKPGKRVLSVLKQLKGGFSDLFLGFAVALSALMGYLLLV